MSHRLDQGKTRFRALVGAALEAQPRLPLIHSTDTYLFEDALADGEIRPHACNVFDGEALTYFFYGRPSFRPNADADPSGLGHYFPICLLFKPDWATVVRRVLPFDSGAFQNGLYGAYLHRKMALGDFGLDPHMDTPGKVISLFFGSVPSYLRGRPANRPKLDPAEFEAGSYSALITASGANSVDSRGSGIEVQTAVAIKLKDAVAAVVMPSTFADGSTGTKLQTLGIEILAYRTIDRMRPGEYTSQLNDLCLDYYVRQKLISEADL